jgi:hypothetical protein
LFDRVLPCLATKVTHTEPFLANWDALVLTDNCHVEPFPKGQFYCPLATLFPHAPGPIAVHAKESVSFSLVARVEEQLPKTDDTLLALEASAGNAEEPYKRLFLASVVTAAFTPAIKHQQ